MNVTRAILPHFRQRRAGVIVNVASMGGRITFPLYSGYHATKWAVEGFTESLQFELRPLGIRVKIVEPGPVKTDFYDRSMDVIPSNGSREYGDLAQRAMPRMQKAGATGATAERVATGGLPRRHRPLVEAALLGQLRRHPRAAQAAARRRLQRRHPRRGLALTPRPGCGPTRGVCCAVAMRRHAEQDTGHPPCAPRSAATTSSIPSL